ncbi:cytidylate kinase [Lachnotalea glycerini]|uniref:Cytidylate kinase n=1 Tax=Lachnotalea glycerini TaxID=1763509 RepID=A0A318EPT2_9FIRM|nr:cytidylate kinase-like family protein [Lachnotalea glycerini]OYO67760.1 cytidylate kinase [Lachnotalea glycerini]PXV87735.1 cytidylate kinase [Lachnotalea glycerini]
MSKYVITIARGYGSGGRTIGKMLSEELGIHYYDRELLRLASDESGINEELFGKADEKIKDSFLYKIMRKSYSGEIITPDSDDFVSNDNLFNFQAKVIRQLAKEEDKSCIVVGRCADYILKDCKNVIRLFVHAPLEHCIDRIEPMSNVSRRELQKKIERIDKHRADYYEYYTHRAWDNAANYDLCINTSELTLQEAVILIMEYIKLRIKE